MIMYNVTISIDPEIQEEWLDWMKVKHIPDVMATNCFIESRIYRVHGEEEGGITYAVGYLCESQEKFDEYTDCFAPGLQKEHTAKYEGRFAAFRTMLTVVEEFKK